MAATSVAAAIEWHGSCSPASPAQDQPDSVRRACNSGTGRARKEDLVPGSAAAQAVSGQPIDAAEERLLSRVRHVLAHEPAGVLLYGSYARGTADAESDIDVLVVTESQPGSVQDRNLSITSYLPDHLRALAERGSLFVLHLKYDGRILYDPLGSLGDILSAYQPPAEPDRLWKELAAAAEGLAAALPDERREHGPGMLQLARYLLRTAVYDLCARSGRPQFDVVAAAIQVGHPELLPVLRDRREEYSDLRLQAAHEALLTVFKPAVVSAASLMATSVRLAQERPYASDLLASVLVGDTLPYTALTLPVG